MILKAFRLAAVVADRLDYLITLARLGALDRLAGPMPESPDELIRAEEPQRRRRRSDAGEFDPSLSLADGSLAFGSTDAPIDAPATALSAD